MKISKYIAVILVFFLLFGCGGSDDSNKKEVDNNGELVDSVGNNNDSSNNEGSKQNNKMEPNRAYQIENSNTITSKDSRTKINITITHETPRKTTARLINGSAILE